jgi:very-short-patch-repair endonuclease
MAQINALAGSLSRTRERARVRARELRQSSPDAEHAIWSALRNRQLGGFKFRRQHPIGSYFADFACVEAMLVVELDGGQHFEPGAIEADARRARALNANGFHVVRFDDRQALTEREGVLTSILEWLQGKHPHPSPLPQAGEGAEEVPPPRAGEGAEELPLPTA